MSTIEQLNERIAQLEQIVLKLVEPQGGRVVGRVEAEEKPAKKTRKTLKPGEVRTKQDGTPRKKPKMSGYRVFSGARRAEVRELLEQNSTVSVRPCDVVSELGRLWKAMGPEEQQIMALETLNQR